MPPASRWLRKAHRARGLALGIVLTSFIAVFPVAPRPHLAMPRPVANKLSTATPSKSEVNGLTEALGAMGIGRKEEDREDSSDGEGKGQEEGEGEEGSKEDSDAERNRKNQADYFSEILGVDQKKKILVSMSSSSAEGQNLLEADLSGSENDYVMEETKTSKTDDYLKQILEKAKLKDEAKDRRREKQRRKQLEEQKLRDTSLAEMDQQREMYQSMFAGLGLPEESVKAAIREGRDSFYKKAGMDHRGRGKADYGRDTHRDFRERGTKYRSDRDLDRDGRREGGSENWRQRDRGNTETDGRSFREGRDWGGGEGEMARRRAERFGGEGNYGVLRREKASSSATPSASVFASPTQEDDQVVPGPPLPTPPAQKGQHADDWQNLEGTHGMPSLGFEASSGNFFHNPKPSHSVSRPFRRDASRYEDTWSPNMPSVANPSAMQEASVDMMAEAIDKQMATNQKESARAEEERIRSRGLETSYRSYRRPTKAYEKPQANRKSLIASEEEEEDTDADLFGTRPRQTQARDFSPFTPSEPRDRFAEPSRGNANIPNKPLSRFELALSERSQSVTNAEVTRRTWGPANPQTPTQSTRPTRYQIESTSYTASRYTRSLRETHAQTPSRPPNLNRESGFHDDGDVSTSSAASAGPTLARSPLFGHRVAEKVVNTYN
ncbi:hypothetical protein AAMO2058_000047500 [Amorphochlora amoebiformis]